MKVAWGRLNRIEDNERALPDLREEDRLESKGVPGSEQ
jgi:hypothetical protein